MENMKPGLSFLQQVLSTISLEYLARKSIQERAFHIALLVTVLSLEAKQLL